MRLWMFLLDRATELRDHITTRTDADAIMAALAVHTARSNEDQSCAGCGFDADGQPLAPMLDHCLTLRALAWRWHLRPEWRKHWMLDAEPYLTTWPPSENCYCGGPEEVFAHRRGTRRHCRIPKWEREHAIHRVPAVTR